METRLLLRAALPLFILCLSAPAGGREFLSLRSGDSLSPEEVEDVLVSPKRTFSGGFHEVGTNAYCFSVWFTSSVDKTVVWMANRDRPVNGRLSTVRLEKRGNLVLEDADGSRVWETAASLPAATSVELSETGNLVLLNQTRGIIWESFASPTDTLLPLQPLTKGNKLVSRSGPGSYSSGYYSLRFSDDNVLKMVYDAPKVTSVYWPKPDISTFESGRFPYNSRRIAMFDSLGHFSSTDKLEFNSSDDTLGRWRRLTLDYDGMARLYTLNGSGNWEVTWKPELHACNVHGLCGTYGICVYSPEPSCQCPPGFRMVDPSDWSRGCSPPSPPKCNSSEIDFLVLQHTDYFGYDLETYREKVSFEDCRNRCLSDCKCKGLAYKLNGTGNCYPKFNLLNGYQMPDYPTVMLIKVSEKETTLIGDSEALNCTEQRSVLLNQYSESESQSPYLKYLVAFVAAAGVVEGMCILFGWWWIDRIHRREKESTMGYQALMLGFKRFTYAELKIATHNFREEIGRGGFGTVFKGVLSDDRVVAVKRLEVVSQGEPEFWAEVTFIGRINHMNLLKMWGFCAEEKHRLLVYEFMENGSVDKILFSRYAASLGWKKRFDIAMGTAKGLCYLHEECLEWILHCDIKPQNILLDENFRPKVGDFGMSKLIEKNNLKYRFSTVRGTRGYLAPEWMINQEITAKADVFSYGVVLLELVTGKSAADFHEDVHNLIQWAQSKLRQGDEMGIVDTSLAGDVNEEQLRRVVKVILMCLEVEKDRRPSMSTVVKALQGDDEDC
ncbi:unnamed protein product [Spirodela intermedia]|uniref:Receptor-like serine/threonine-protein kinase n=1 Tax=Spirodela intermedia TaxID=51605 RepID=A0A7I8IBB9_SPIIN|nr:unnamed protein product [Spirodela intermedia]CAA6655047.1 unnamed protein product [Spirodela intermedia]